MEAEPSDAQAADAAAACPRWVMLSRHSDRRAIADDAKATLAGSHTSSGHLLHVCFPLTSPPPACSALCHDWPLIADSAARIQGPEIIAAHADCLLLEVMSGDPDRWRDTAATDYFLYEAAAGSRPPALLLLPTCFIPMTFQRKKHDEQEDLLPDHDDEDLTLHDDDQDPAPSPLWSDYTGIIRRRDGEVVVARLEVPKATPRRTAELCVLDTGRLKCEINREVPIFHRESTAGEAQELMEWWKTDAAVAVGDRFLCFVDYFRGFLLCDKAAADVAAHELRYVPLPLEVSPNRFPGFFDDDRPSTQMFRNLAAVTATAVRFVTVDRRCCCGGHGVSTCEHGQFLFKVTMWTLSLTTDDESPATWVMDSELDCEELWAMPGYGSLPRTERLTFPVVRCDDPDVVCFVVRSPYRCSMTMNREDRKVWVLEIDMRSKELRSVTVYNNSDGQAEYQVAAQLKCY